MAKIDHHVHTSRHSPDSVIEPEALVERARLAGLDAVVITEHDYQWEPGELAELNAEAGGLVVLSGVEVSAREGHFLVYGLPDLGGVGPGIELGELLKVVREHDAAIVGAHPFRWDQDFGKIVRDHGPAFDALELVSNNVTPETRARTEALLKAHPMGSTGSSDGHAPEAVGCYYTDFPGEVRTIGDFVQALRKRTGRPRHRAGAWQTSGRWIDWGSRMSMVPESSPSVMAIREDPHPAFGHLLPEGEGNSWLPLPPGEGRGEGHRPPHGHGP